MADKRMMSKKVIHGDNFMDLPATTKVLYFYLMIDADDDGFVNSPKRIQRMVGSTDDDAKLLLAKKFILQFESGIIVVKHWKMHNYIRSDRYKETTHLYEKSILSLSENGVYHMDTIGIPSGSIDKIRLGEIRIDENKEESKPKQTQAKSKQMEANLSKTEKRVSDKEKEKEKEIQPANLDLSGFDAIWKDYTLGFLKKQNRKGGSKAKAKAKYKALIDHGYSKDDIEEYVSYIKTLKVGHKDLERAFVSSEIDQWLEDSNTKETLEEKKQRIYNDPTIDRYSKKYLIEEIENEQRTNRSLNTQQLSTS